MLELSKIKAAYSEYDFDKGLKVTVGNTTKTYPNVAQHVGGFIVGFFEWMRRNPGYYKIVFEDAETDFNETALLDYVENVVQGPRTPRPDAKLIDVCPGIQTWADPDVVPYVYTIAIASQDYERVLPKLMKHIVCTTLKKELGY